MATNEIESLSLQIKNLANRIEEIESYLDLSNKSVIGSEKLNYEKRSLQNNSIPILVNEVVSPLFQKVAPSLTSVEREEIKKTQEKSNAGNLLGIVASICFILAGVFIVKLAIDQGWLTPVRQIGLAALFSISLIVTGMVLSKRDSEYASFLPACGIILLYADSFGAYYFYQLAGPFEAISGACVTSLLSLLLYTRFSNELYTILSAVGCYTLPLILPELRSDFSLLACYFLVFTFSTSFISAHIESRIYSMVAAYLGIGILAFCGLSSPHPADWSTAAFAQFAQFIFFATGAVYYSLRNRSPLSKDQVWTYFPLLLFFYATEFMLITKVSEAWAPWISFGFAGFLCGIYHFSKKYLEHSQLRSGQVLVAFCSVVAFHSGYWILLPTEIKPLLLFLILFGAPLIVSKNRKSNGTAIPLSWRVPVIAMTLICCIEYVRILEGFSYRRDGDYGFYILKGLVCALGLIGFCRKIKMENYLILILAHIQSVFALYRLAYDQGSLAVSSAWGIYALAVLGAAFAMKDKIIGQSSAIVLGIAAAKVLVYDTSSAAPGIRIVCLIMTGVLLYFGGFLFRRIATWK